MTESRESSEVFERLVVPEIPVLLRVARSLTSHDAEAEDLVQDTLLRAYRAVDRFDGRHPRAWLLTILRNTHINRNRRQRPELLRDPEGAADLPASGDLADPSGFVDHLFDAEVTRALERLDPTFRAVIDLVDIGGLSYADAARTLDIPVGTVMSRLHRARKRIREHLRRSGVAVRTP